MRLKNFTKLVGDDTKVVIRKQGMFYLLRADFELMNSKGEFPSWEYNSYVPVDDVVSFGSAWDTFSEYDVVQVDVFKTTYDYGHSYLMITVE